MGARKAEGTDGNGKPKTKKPRRALVERIKAFTVDQMAALREKATETLEVISNEALRRRKELKRLSEVPPAVDADATDTQTEA